MVSLQVLYDRVLLAGELQHLDWAVCDVGVHVASRTGILDQPPSSTSVNFLRISDNPARRVPSWDFYVTSAPILILTYSKTNALLQGVLISNLASLHWGNYTQVAVIVVQLLVLAIFKARYLVLFAGFMNAWLYTQETMLLCAADPWQIVCVLVAKFSWEPGLLSKEFFQAVINVANLEAERVAQGVLFACWYLECCHRSFVLLCGAECRCMVQLWCQSWVRFVSLPDCLVTVCVLRKPEGFPRNSLHSRSQ